MSRRRPPAVVVDGDALDGVTLVGWAVTPIDGLPAEPFDLSKLRLAAVARVTSRDDQQAVLIAVARGAAAVVGLDVDGAEVEEFLDDLGRLADLDGVAQPLAGDQEQLLAAIAGGATIAETAKRLGMSRRTAVRRLADARRQLGVTSTAEAVRLHASGSD
jgi:DNA-binding CsgD family transcriptional regulator